MASNLSASARAASPRSRFRVPLCVPAASSWLCKQTEYCPRPGFWIFGLSFRCSHVGKSGTGEGGRRKVRDPSRALRGKGFRGVGRLLECMIISRFYTGFPEDLDAQASGLGILLTTSMSITVNGRLACCF